MSIIPFPSMLIELDEPELVKIVEFDSHLKSGRHSFPGLSLHFSFSVGATGGFVFAQQTCISSEK